MSINNDTARITQELSALRGQINHSSDYHEAVQHGHILGERSNTAPSSTSHYADKPPPPFRKCRSAARAAFAGAAEARTLREGRRAPATGNSEAPGTGTPGGRDRGASFSNLSDVLLVNGGCFTATALRNRSLLEVRENCIYFFLLNL